MKAYTFFQNDPALEGNQASITICFCERWISNREMQQRAMLLQHTKTAFVFRSNPQRKEFSIRYFSPVAEIDLCVDTTFAAARLIMSQVEVGMIAFKTGNDETIRARKIDGQVFLDFAHIPFTPCPPHPGISRALGIRFVRQTLFCPAFNYLLVEAGSPVELLSLVPDFNRLKNTTTKIRSVIVTASAAHTSEDFSVRSFSPWQGLNEDRMLGIAHVFLASYWKKQLNRNVLVPWGHYGITALIAHDHPSVTITSSPLRFSPAVPSFQYD